MIVNRTKHAGKARFLLVCFLLVYIVTGLLLSGCETTANKSKDSHSNRANHGDHRDHSDHRNQTEPLAVDENKLTEQAQVNPQVSESLAAIDTISVQEYQIKKQALYRITFSNPLSFDFASDGVQSIKRDDIRAFTRLYQQKTLGAYLYVVGHTDSVGSAVFNQSLSARRGYSVANLLVQNGVAADKIKIVAAGESIPMASNQSQAGQAKNRRVEILSSNSMTLNLEFFRQFDCTAIDAACQASALPVFDVVNHQGQVQMRVPKDAQRIETMTEQITRRALALPIQIRQSLNYQLDVRKVLSLDPKYWFDKKQ